MTDTITIDHWGEALFGAPLEHLGEGAIEHRRQAVRDLAKDYGGAIREEVEKALKEHDDKTN
jgi:hypothetical protein